MGMPESQTEAFLATPFNPAASTQLTPVNQTQTSLGPSNPDLTATELPGPSTSGTSNAKPYVERSKPIQTRVNNRLQPY